MDFEVLPPFDLDPGEDPGQGQKPQVQVDNPVQVGPQRTVPARELERSRLHCCSRLMPQTLQVADGLGL